MHLLTVSQAAKKAGVTPDHMRRLLTSRKIYGIKHGQTWIVMEDEVLRYKRSTRGRPPKITSS